MSWIAAAIVTKNGIFLLLTIHWWKQWKWMRYTNVWSLSTQLSGNSMFKNLILITVNFVCSLFRRLNSEHCLSGIILHPEDKCFKPSYNFCNICHCNLVGGKSESCGKCEEHPKNTIPKQEYPRERQFQKRNYTQIIVKTSCRVSSNLSNIPKHLFDNIKSDVNHIFRY